MGIDIGKTSSHIVGLDRRGAIVLRQKWSRGAGRSTAGQDAALPDRHGGLCRCASRQSQAQSEGTIAPAFRACLLGEFSTTP
jgi:hypothetical protein